MKEDLADYFRERLEAIYDSPDALAQSLAGYDYSEDGTAPYGYSYLADGKVWICMEVPHALGDYIEIELDTSDPAHRAAFVKCTMDAPLMDTCMTWNGDMQKRRKTHEKSECYYLEWLYGWQPHWQVVEMTQQPVQIRLRSRSGTVRKCDHRDAEPMGHRRMRISNRQQPVPSDPDGESAKGLAQR